MKKTLITMLILFFAIPFLVIPIPNKGNDGGFNTISGLWWCSDKPSCLHEIGHKLDKEAGWISKTDEFGMAVKVFLRWQYKVDEKPSKLVDIIIHSSGLFEFGGYFDNPQAELYANIFEYTDGKKENAPVIFQNFYDWQRADALMEY